MYKLVMMDSQGDDWDIDWSRAPLKITRRRDGLEEEFGGYMQRYGFRKDDGEPYCLARYEEASP